MKPLMKGEDIPGELLVTPPDEGLEEDEVLYPCEKPAHMECSGYQALFELTPVASLITDGKGEIRDANRAATLLLGTPLEVMVGTLLAEHVLADDRERFRARLAQLGQVKHAQEWSVRMHPWEGELLEVDDSVGPIRDSTGRCNDCIVNTYTSPPQ
jgi:PAS domain S-box-containing protein